MQVKELELKDCLLFKPEIYKDERGTFFEWFQNSVFTEYSNKPFELVQVNCSVSRKGVLRGIHYTRKNPGQSKIVTCLSGKIFDVLFDLRKNSPTFGNWQSIELDSLNPSAVYVPWGVGHGFMALSENSVVTYLCDLRYDPKNEFDLNALDPNLKIDWPSNFEVIQSIKDKNAPMLEDVIADLPE